MRADEATTIDVDRPETWPHATREWAAGHAVAVAGTTRYTCDLALDECEEEFRATFGGGALIAYHCTRLLSHEVEAIREQGLRLLDESLVRERIEAARSQGALSPEVQDRAERGNIYAIGNLAGREAQICFVLGRTIFDDAHGCVPLLAHWGGEAMRGSPQASPLLATIGVPTIVVARLDFSSSAPRATARPGLAKMFVGRILGTELCVADVFYRDPVPAGDLLDIWQPGHPEYDQYPRLPH